MKENQSNEIDKAFRDGLGNFSETPPPKVWDGLRFGLIERRLIGVEKQNYWLKITSGLLSTAVIVLLSLLYKGNAAGLAIKPQSERIVFRDKLLHDTVYISKTEKVYVPVKQIVYVNESTKPDNDKIVNTSKLTEPIENDKNFTLNEANTKNNIQEKNSNAKNENKVDANKIIEKNTNESYLTNNSITQQDNVFNNTIENKQNLDLSLLDFRNFDSLNVFIKLPNINYRTRTIFRKVVKEDNKIALKNLSLKLFYAPETAKAPMLTDRSLVAETIALERNHNTYSFGANISADLTNRWSIETGLASSYTEFKMENAVKKRPVFAEMYNGKPSFVYRTALGAAIIPTEKLNTQPNVGNNSIIVESEEKHLIKQLRVPLLAKYQLYEGRKMFGNYTNKYSLYQILGTELRINRSQMVNAEIYEPDGHDFYVSLTDFKEVNKYNLGFVFGAGFKYSLDQKLNFYFEPTIRFTTSSYSQSTIVSSYPRWWSFAFGFQYNLKK
jgi:hypothetical protein